VELELDPNGRGLSFGIIGESSIQNWWSLFTPRFGKVSWKTRVDRTEEERSDEVLRARMDRNPVDVVLVETGRLRPGSPVWGGAAASVVLSLDGWRRPPPKAMAHTTNKD
jgi:hypothetical protein